MYKGYRHNKQGFTFFGNYVHLFYFCEKLFVRTEIIIIFFLDDDDIILNIY